jgi:hypothetical protein
VRLLVIGQNNKRCTVQRIENNIVPETSPGGKGGRCVGLTTLPPSCYDCLEVPDGEVPAQAINGTSLPSICTAVSNTVNVLGDRFVQFGRQVPTFQKHHLSTFSEETQITLTFWHLVLHLNFRTPCM